MNLVTKREKFYLFNDIYDYVGHISSVIDLRKDIIIIKHKISNIYYLNIYGKHIDEKYMLMIDINDEKQINKIVKRYNKQQIMDKVRINNMIYNPAQITYVKTNVYDSQKNIFIQPKLVDSNKYGWHMMHILVSDDICFEDVEKLENKLVSDENTYDSKLMTQMTAFNAKQDVTTIETLYSASIIMYEYDYKSNKVYKKIYYHGENANDIPVDVIYHMEHYDL